jgi:hypothetical protein
MIGKAALTEPSPQYRLLRKHNAPARRGTESERFGIPDENTVVRVKVKQYNALRVTS